MDSTGSPPLPLAGFRVLGLARFLARPYAAMAAADLGADVIERGAACSKHPEAAQ